jgi:hypothetical protein
MSQKPDDLNALRTILAALEPFEEIERERILRWTSEKLGIKSQLAAMPQGSTPMNNSGANSGTLQTGTKDIKSFLADKSPTSANQLIAAVAYYYKFEASPSERKSSITADDVVDACRKAGRERPKFPNEIMSNAKNFGLIDNVGTGLYELNTVGENLVAVSMPTTGGSNQIKKRETKKAKGSAKKKKK